MEADTPGCVCSFVRDPLIGRLQVPGLDALQVLLEALGEAKRPCAELAHVRHGVAQGAPSAGRGSLPCRQLDQPDLR